MSKGCERRERRHWRDWRERHGRAGASRAMGVYAIVRGIAAAWVALLLILTPVAVAWAQDGQDGQAGQVGGAGPATPTGPANPIAGAGGDAAQSGEEVFFDLLNPISVLQNASRAMPLGGGGGEGGAADELDATSIEGGDLSATLSILLLLTVLSLAPALLVMVTSFTRIVVVLALLRQALGTQGLPPSQVIVGLALFMTFLVMAPTFQRINAEALTPLQAGEVNELQAWGLAKQPLRDFMFAQIEYADNWDDVYMILNYRGVDTSEPEHLQRRDVDMLTLIPAFILSELKIAFLIGFRIYLPFLIIDMVVASILISMGMLMLPPVLISLPFKLLLFVLVDGWMLVAGHLLNSFAVPGVTT